MLPKPSRACRGEAVVGPLVRFVCAVVAADLVERQKREPQHRLAELYPLPANVSSGSISAARHDEPRPVGL